MEGGSIQLHQIESLLGELRVFEIWRNLLKTRGNSKVLSKVIYSTKITRYHVQPFKMKINN